MADDDVLVIGEAADLPLAVDEVATVEILLDPRFERPPTRVPVTADLVMNDRVEVEGGTQHLRVATRPARGDGKDRPESGCTGVPARTEIRHMPS